MLIRSMKSSSSSLIRTDIRNKGTLGYASFEKRNKEETVNNKQGKKMKQFKAVQKLPQTKVPIMQCCIDTPNLDQFRVGVYNNEDGYTVDVDFTFTTPQAGWGQGQDIKLRNNLHKINNIAYKQPAELEFASAWYKHAVEQARAFGKRHNSNLHTKLGFQFKNRFHTVPYTYFSYCGLTHDFLLQCSIPDASDNEFTHHMEVQGELTMHNNKNLRWEHFA